MISEQLKAVEKFRAIVDATPRLYSNSYQPTSVSISRKTAAAVLERLDELEAAARWISVGEALPEPLQSVLITDANGLQNRAWISREGHWDSPMNVFLEKGVQPTHWRALSAPPQETSDAVD